jgi:hypothetical protein
MAIRQVSLARSIAWVVALSFLPPCAAEGKAAEVKGRRELPVIRDPTEQAPAKPKLSEAEQQSVAGDPYGTVVGLNPVIFSGNVLREGEDGTADSWVVYFCPTWWQPCVDLLKPFALQSSEWQTRLNDGLFSNQVRFARVDCASHKPLCNQEGVQNYPTVTHYQRGQQVAKWSGNGRNDDKRLVKWLAERLGPVPAASAVPSTAGEVRLAIASCMPTSERLVDVAVILAVVGLNLWAVWRNPQMIWKTGSASKSPLSATAAKPSEAAELAGGVGRIIPVEWAGRGRSSLEL